MSDQDDLAAALAQALGPSGVQQQPMLPTPPAGQYSFVGGPTAANAGAINSYNTPLTPDQESQFQAWAATKWGPGVDGDGRSVSDATRDYDMRGYWLSGGSQAGNGHFPDTFKKPSHPTFSDESQYSAQQGGAGGPGGQWVQDGAGNWTDYNASAANLQHYTPQALAQYFSAVEPDTKLNLLGPNTAFGYPGKPSQ